VPVLDLEVSPDLLGRWTCWLAPAWQPFFVEDSHHWPEGRAAAADGMTAEQSLRGQADGHRFVWWPSLLAVSPARILERFVADEADATRHRAVAPTTWRSCAAVLPGARELAGTFADGSGPNCFGTVLAAAGVDGAAEDWVQQEAFEDWLARSCEPGGTDDAAGTVVVWRDSVGVPVHAAVTIGQGFALEKAAQTWWTPRIVATVDEVKRASRAPGQRLERHRIVVGAT
jgi:hypothetical protein